MDPGQRAEVDQAQAERQQLVIKDGAEVKQCLADMESELMSAEMALGDALNAYHDLYNLIYPSA